MGVSSGLTSWETPVHAARSDREKKKLGKPRGVTRRREGRKFSVSSLLFGVFLRWPGVSPPGPGFHPTALGEDPGSERWVGGDVSEDPFALCLDISDSEAAGLSQPEPGIAEFWSFSDTGFLWESVFRSH